MWFLAVFHDMTIRPLAADVVVIVINSFKLRSLRLSVVPGQLLQTIGNRFGVAFIAIASNQYISNNQIFLCEARGWQSIDADLDQCIIGDNDLYENYLVVKEIG